MRTRSRTRAWLSLTVAGAIAACPAHSNEAESPVAVVETPPATAGAPAPPPEALIGEIPFDSRGAAVRVQIDLAPDGSRELRFMLDTGASGTVVTPLFARKLGVSVRRHKATPYRRATSLGRDLQFWVDTRSSDTGSKTGWEYGLLGGDFLDDYVLEIDYPNRVVRFLDPEKYEVPETTSAPDERIVPLRIQGSRPFVDLEINGKVNPVLLDTGAPDNVIISGRAAKKFGIDWKTLPNLTEYGTVVGNMQVRLYESDSVRFGGFELEALPVMVAPKGWFNQAGNTDSVVGYDILRQFVLRIDYERGRLWLKRTGATGSTYANVDYELIRRTGAFFVKQGFAYYIIGVVPDSLAAKAGVRPGDAMTFDLGGSIQAWVGDVAEGNQVLVSRKVNDVYLDVMLPEDEWASGDED